MRAYRRAILLALALVALAAAGCDLQCPAGDGLVRQSIRNRLDSLPEPQGRHYRVEETDVTAPVREFYRARHDRPAWVTTEGAELVAFKMLSAIEDADRRGLTSRDYDLSRIRHLFAAVDPALRGPRLDPRRLGELDMRLTRAWFLLGTHLLQGRAIPRYADPEWHLPPRQRDLAKALERALDTGTIAASLDSLEPATPSFLALERALARYRALEKGWPSVPAGPPIKTGATGERVQRLRARLLAEGDLDSSQAQGDLYDRPLRDAVLRFQRRHGLDTTGVVRDADLAALNVPAVERARQIALNLERMRWMTDTLDARYAQVNIPEFTVRIFDNDTVAFECRTVVGTDSTQTPAFRAALKLMVINPYWRIPPKIAAREILDQIRKDPEYLARNSIRVMEGTGPTAREVDPTKVNWSKLDPSKFIYRLLQDPGPENAVGHVKFMCPNPYSIYLHDTPAGHLFKLRNRAFSHGCVRVEKPLDLARYLLRGKPDWDSTRIVTAFDSSKNEVVFLPAPLPVHIVYFTAWVDTAGRVNFRRDLYGLDQALEEALAGTKPVLLDERRRLALADSLAAEAEKAGLLRPKPPKRSSG